jgi:hypothetical protein
MSNPPSARQRKSKSRALQNTLPNALTDALTDAVGPAFEPLENRVMMSGDIDPYSARFLLPNSFPGVETATISPGGKYALQISAQNTGDAAYNSKGLESIAWLVKDGDPDDQEHMRLLTVFTDKTGQTIEPSAVNFYTQTVAVPLTLAPGTYHLFSAWNTATNILENNNGNNSYVNPEPITVADPFSQITDALSSTFASTVLAGASGKVTLSITNPLSLPLAGKVAVNLFASTDALLDGNDVALGKGQLLPTKTTTLSNKAPANITLSPTIPDNLAEGDYYIVADVTVSAPTGGTLFHTTLALPTPIHVNMKPLIAVAATVAEGSEEAGHAAKFTLTRTHSLGTPVAVSFTVGGTAKKTADYVLSTGNTLANGGTALTATSVTFGADVSTLDLFVNPVDDARVEQTENVTLTLKAGALYAIDPINASAAVTILNFSPTVGLTLAQPADGLASESGMAGHITLTRTGATTTPLAVTLTVSGTATSGKDYAKLNLKVVIPIGASSIVIDITPLADALAEPAETVIVGFAAPNAKTAYVIGVDNAAIVSIADVPAV